MSTTTAYGLRAEYDGHVELDGETVPTFTGGLIRAGARELDLREELDRNGGTIIVASDDYAAVNALDAHPALKRVASHGAPATLSRWDGLNLNELREAARERDLATGGSKAELVERLDLHQAAVEAGDTVTANADHPENVA